MNSIDHGTIQSGTTHHGMFDNGMADHDASAHDKTMRAGTLPCRTRTTCGASRWPPLLLLASALASAQAMAQHAQTQAPATPAATAPATQPAPRQDHSSMDHSSMDHSSMDHSSMDHSSMDHSSMDHSSMDHSSMDHSSMDHSSMDHSTMDHSTMDHSTMDHSSMDHSSMGHGAKKADKPPAPTTSRTPIPPITDADRAAARGPEHDDHGMHDHDDRVYRFLMIDRLETWDDEHGRALAWEAAGWVGTDHHRLWLRSEGEREDGSTGHVETELLYGRPIAPWWDLLAGVRHDAAPGASRTELAFGVMGMAPYKFEVDATLYVGENGRTSVVAEAEYELLLTSRLILQPTLEAEWHSRRDAERGVGAGLSTLEAGLRLRYEWHRRFAPYVGVVHERSFGGTADFAREEGDAARETRVVAGVRIWF